MSEKKDVPPTILMMELDDDTRPLLKLNLGNWGYHVISALQEEDAIALARGVCDRPDLILLNQVDLPIDEVISMGGAFVKDQNSPAARRLSLWLSTTGRIWKARTLKWAKVST
jgi:CheY-like chemotaxis protein